MFDIEFSVHKGRIAIRIISRKMEKTMKKIRKSAAILLFAGCMAFCSIMQVDAVVAIEPTVYGTYYPAKDKFPNTLIHKNHMWDGSNTRVKDYVFSKKGILEIKKYKYNFFGKKKQCQIFAKKPGTVTMKLAAPSGYHGIKKKFVLRKYKNPFSKITLNGKDITSQFNKSSCYTMPYKNYKGKKLDITASFKKDWKVKSFKPGETPNISHDLASEVRMLEKEQGKLVASWSFDESKDPMVFDHKGDGYFVIAVNKKTKQEIFITFNSK